MNKKSKYTEEEDKQYLLKFPPNIIIVDVLIDIFANLTEERLFENSLFREKAKRIWSEELLRLLIYKLFVKFSRIKGRTSEEIKNELTALINKVHLINCTLRNQFNWPSGKNRDAIELLKREFLDLFDITAASELIKNSLEPESLLKTQDEAGNETRRFRDDIMGLSVILSEILKDKPVPGDCKESGARKYLSFFSKGVTKFLKSMKTGKSIPEYEKLSSVDNENKTK